MENLDATGFNPGDMRMFEDGHVRIVKVWPILNKMDGEYETKLRWHLPKWRADYMAVRKFLKGSVI